LYSTAAPLTLPHYTPLGMDHSFAAAIDIFNIFFQRKAGALEEKKERNTCLMKLINVSINNKMN